MQSEFATEGLTTTPKTRPTKKPKIIAMSIGRLTHLIRIAFTQTPKKGEVSPESHRLFGGFNPLLLCTR